MKECSRCHETKDVKCFHKNKLNPDGRQYVCNDCRKEYLKKVTFTPKIIPDKKVCNRCKKEKSHIEFDRRSCSPNGLCNICKECKRGSRNKRAAYAIQIKRDYGISIEQYDEILEKQNGMCAICDNKDIKLFIDHNHDTGQIRSLLCRHCNTGLGFFKENIEILKKAISYIERFNEPICLTT